MASYAAAISTGRGLGRASVAVKRPKIKRALPRRTKVPVNRFGHDYREGIIPAATKREQQYARMGGSTNLNRSVAYSRSLRKVRADHTFSHHKRLQKAYRSLRYPLAAQDVYQLSAAKRKRHAGRIQVSGYTTRSGKRVGTYARSR